MACVAISPREDVWAGALSTALSDYTMSTRSKSSTSCGVTGLRVRNRLFRGGTRLASRSADKTVRVWKVGDGELLFETSGLSASLGNIAFSPDGGLIAAPGEESTVLLLDSRTGAVHQELRGHSACVRSVAFSPDGKWLASAGDDQTVSLWNLQNATFEQGLFCSEAGWVSSMLGRCSSTGDLHGQFWGASALCRFEANSIEALFATKRVRKESAMIRERIRDYRIMRSLGSGGMAETYAAVHEHSGRKAAIKIPLSVHGAYPELDRRFLHEGRVLSQLSMRIPASSRSTTGDSCRRDGSS